MTPQTLRFAASASMLMIIVLLMLYLTFIEVPVGNKDIIITILGVLLGAGAAAIPNLFGDSDKEKAALKKRIISLEKHVERLEGVNVTLANELNEIRKMLITRHVVKGEGYAQLPPTAQGS